MTEKLKVVLSEFNPESTTLIQRVFNYRTT